MSRTVIYMGMVLGGWVGWWGGDLVGFGIMGSFLVSSVGSFAGIYLGWRVTRDFLE